MKEQLISFELAKLAKEKGFDIASRQVYNKDGELESAVDFTGNEFFDEGDILNAISNGEETYLAPTLSLLQKWLRDNYQIHITITSISQESWQYHITKPKMVLGDIFGEDYADYESALEDGLLESLKLI